VLISWGLGLLLLASPFGLLRFGFLPPLTPARLAVTALLGGLCFLQCARVRRFWPAIVLLAWPAAFVLAIETRFPCWRGSNAAWCGHACDGPPEEGCGPADFGDPNPPAGRD
jgi:ABC-type branched-subunit amino acid transport system permease subunit